jgi:transcriptional regulator with XRE-family HTH domain
MTTAERSYGLRDLERRLGKMTLGTFLRSWRLSEGLSQAEFARRLGMSPANLCDVEKGRKGVSAKKAANIARRLGYSAQVLVQLAINDELSAAGLPFTVKLDVA